MTYDEIKNFDWGSLPNPNHPGQKNISYKTITQGGNFKS